MNYDWNLMECSLYSDWTCYDSPGHHWFRIKRWGHNWLRSKRLGHDWLVSKRLGHHWLRSKRLGHHWLVSKRPGHHWLRSKRLGHHWLRSKRLGHDWLVSKRPGHFRISSPLPESPLSFPHELRIKHFCVRVVVKRVSHQVVHGNVILVSNWHQVVRGSWGSFLLLVIPQVFSPR